LVIDELSIAGQGRRVGLRERLRIRAIAPENEGGYNFRGGRATRPKVEVL